MNIFDETTLKRLQTSCGEEQQHTILIVDDERESLNTMTYLLRDDYQILTASSGIEALDVIRDEPNPDAIHLIITDQRMPDMTGVEFLAKSIKLVRNAVRIMLTGFSDIDAVIDSVNIARVHRFILKPYDPQQLRRAVRDALAVYDRERQSRGLFDELKAMNVRLESRFNDRTLELNEKSRELIKLNEEIHEFIGIVAHDLGNPLSALLGYANMIKEEYDSAPKDTIFEYADIIANRSDRMLTIINNLMDIDAIESGKMRLRWENIRINDVLKQIVADYSPKADRKRITLYPTYASEMCTLYADRDAIYRVLDNLVSNAIKYSPPEKTVMINLSEDEEYLRCEVKDEGPGLNDDDMKRLFGKFARLSAKPTEGEPSNGLGLYIVKKMVELTNGQVLCESRPAEGTTFIVEWPIIIET